MTRIHYDPMSPKLFAQLRHAARACRDIDALEAISKAIENEYLARYAAENRMKLADKYFDQAERLLRHPTQEANR